MGEGEINNVNPKDTKKKRSEVRGQTMENKTARKRRRREDRCSRQFRSRVSTCPPYSSTSLIIQI